jgi:hypothetical protein
MKQCGMMVLPDVEYDDECPCCTATNVGALHLTDQFCSTSYEDEQPNFRPVNYCSRSYDSDNEGSVGRGIHKISARLARNGYASELPRAPSPSYSLSPPLSPMNRRWSSPPWASPPSSDESWDGNTAHRDGLQVKQSRVKELDLHDPTPLCVMTQGGSLKTFRVAQRQGGVRRTTYQPPRRSPEPEKHYCKYGTHRELNMMGDRISLQLCFGHEHATMLLDKTWPCPE